MTTPSCDDRCPPLPDGFVRLRYFFGKRLGAADLRDEQAYHRGQARFHARHLHGAGVVCGLGLSPYDATAAPTVLKVGAGAALDPCGGLVVVPLDQCIDVASWFRRRGEEAERIGETFPPAGAVTDEGRMRICVVLRALEHLTSPEVAPTDPCSSASGGCEYGRVEETFQLELRLDGETDGVSLLPRTPAIEALRAALEGAAGPDELRAALARALGEGCADDAEPWIRLGCLEAVVDTVADPPVVTALSDPAGWSGPDGIVLSTAALLELLVETAYRNGGAAAVRGLELRADGGDPFVALTLGAPVLEPTLDPTSFELRRLDPATGWEAPLALGVTAQGAPEPRLDLAPPAGALVAGDVFGLEIRSDGQPALDDTFRPIGLSAVFVVEDDGGTLRARLTHWQPRRTEVP
jgi:hypothetical protein